MKWLVVAAVVVLQLALGSVLGWSVFGPALKSGYGLSAAQAGFIFGLYIAVFTLGSLIGGRIQQARGPRQTALLGALLAGAGWVVASLSDGNLPMLTAGIGVLTGLGNGFAYIGTLVACVRWFPSAPGRATGAAVVGTGAGAILLTAIAQHMLGRGVDVLVIFRWLGLAFGSVMFCCAALLVVPPGGATAARPKVPLAELLATRHFWALTLALFGGTFGALIVMGHLKAIGLQAGQTDSAAALAVAVYAAGNAAGRLAWGAAYDRLGRSAVLLSLAGLLVGILALLVATSLPAFLVAAVWLGASFGATMVLYASDVATVWGHDRVGSVYPVMYLAYGLAGITSPGLGGWLRDVTGNYLLSILLAAAIVAAGTAAYWLLTWRREPLRRP
jgi:OFA family oxalate/formate antiporter-like MFS transporter